MKIVGITGSYGKSTTKEILKMILGNRTRTVATSKNINTDIGVANTILENLGMLTDVFIVEMGAYKQGEIEKICDIVPPDISVITSISEQHLALFGTLENTLQTKYEIIEYAKPDSIAILNGDDTTVLRVAQKSGKKEIMYSTKKELDVWASDIKSKGTDVTFSVHHKKQTQRFEVRMLGEHNVSNILAATSVALTLEMTLKDIAAALKTASKRHKIGRMSIRKSLFGYEVIDDSYNSNSAGFAAALDVLNYTKAERRIVVSIGLIELGAKSESVYKQLAKKITEIADVLVTTSVKLAEAVEKEDSKFEIVFDQGVDRQLSFLKNKVRAKDVVLFEGPNQRLISEIVKK